MNSKRGKKVAAKAAAASVEVALSLKPVAAHQISWLVV
jgi:hypothetical protein